MYVCHVSFSLEASERYLLSSSSYRTGKVSSVSNYLNLLSELLYNVVFTSATVCLYGTLPRHSRVYGSIRIGSVSLSAGGVVFHLALLVSGSHNLV